MDLTDIDATQYADRQRLLAHGITPRAIERAYGSGSFNQLARDHGIPRPQLTEAARQWGVTNPRYPGRKGEGAHANASD